MPGNAERWASLAAEKLTAKSVAAGQYDLILDPTNLWLTIHESIGHPTELDRAVGPGGQLRRHELRRAAGESDRQAPLWPRIHEHPGRPHAGGIALPRGVGRRRACPRTVADHREGHLQGLPDDARAGGVDSETHRREPLARLFVRRSWNGVQFQRMPNISLLAGRTRHLARRHRLGDRSRHPHQEPRLLVDRPPALQLPVFRTGVSTRCATERSPACCATWRTRATRRCSGTRWT